MRKCLQVQEIKNYREDLRKNMVAKGISRVKDKFTWHNAALKLENIYHQMIESHANNKHSKT